MESALDPPLASLKVTHVFYNPNDPLSLLSAYLALIPQGLMVIYVTLIYSRREIEVLLMFVGQLLCEGANWRLKRLIKEDRPPGTFISFPSLVFEVFCERELNGRNFGGGIWDAE